MAEESNVQVSKDSGVVGWYMSLSVIRKVAFSSSFGAALLMLSAFPEEIFNDDRPGNRVNLRLLEGSSITEAQRVALESAITNTIDIPISYNPGTARIFYFWPADGNRVTRRGFLLYSYDAEIRSVGDVLLINGSRWDISDLQSIADGTAGPGVLSSWEDFMIHLNWLEEDETLLSSTAPYGVVSFPGVEAPLPGSPIVIQRSH